MTGVKSWVGGLGGESRLVSIAKSLLPEFDHEMAGTRKMLERAPATHASWRPHEMSMTLAQLTTHLAEIPRYVPRIIHDDELELHPVGGEPFERKTPLPVEAAVPMFDENVSADERLQM